MAAAGTSSGTGGPKTPLTEKETVTRCGGAVASAIATAARSEWGLLLLVGEKDAIDDVDDDDGGDDAAGDVGGSSAGATAADVARGERGVLGFVCACFCVPQIRTPTVSPERKGAQYDVHSAVPQTSFPLSWKPTLEATAPTRRSWRRVRVSPTPMQTPPPTRMCASV